MSQHRVRLEREKLYEEVWAEPITVIAARYNLSDVGMAKACRRMSIPLPGRGYWARVRAGQSMKKIPLPPLPRNSDSFINVTRLSEQEVSKKLAEKIKKQATPIEQIKVDEVLTDPHPLVKAAQKRLSMKTGWDDERGIRKAPTEVMDIAVTLDSLDRALRLMNALVKKLVSRGVAISINSAQGQTILTLDGIKVPLSISEQLKRTDHVATPEETIKLERQAKRTSWSPSYSYFHLPKYDYHPTGSLTITVGHWPTRNCRDTNNTALEERLGEVVNSAFEVARIVKERELEMARAAEARRLAAERYELATQRLEVEKKALDKLESKAKNFQRSRRIQAYAQAVEESALAAGNMTSELESWIAWAKLKADWLNPINQISDLILDAPLPKRPGYW